MNALNVIIPLLAQNIIAGLLIGVALVVNPIVHNYYYLLLLPLVAALLDDRLQQPETYRGFRTSPLAVWSFMIVDLLARLPGIGGKLRDWGFPLASLIWLLIAGAMALRKQKSKPTSGAPCGNLPRRNEAELCP